MVNNLIIRVAAKRCCINFSLIKELAEYEKLSDQISTTESQLENTLLVMKILLKYLLQKSKE